MKKIVLLSGKARHGKDSTAEVLIKHLNGKCLVLPFAKYLKIMCKDYFGWQGKKDDIGRSILQNVGTGLIREKLGWENFHVNRICEDIKIAENEFDYILIPDARRKNEIFYTQAMFPDKTFTIRVKRLNFASSLTEEQQNHISEVDLDDFKFDHYIESKDGLENLEMTILESDLIDKLK